MKKSFTRPIRGRGFVLGLVIVLVVGGWYGSFFTVDPERHLIGFLMQLVAFPMALNLALDLGLSPSEVILEGNRMTLVLLFTQIRNLPLSEVAEISTPFIGKIFGKFACMVRMKNGGFHFLSDRIEGLDELVERIRAANPACRVACN